MDEEKLNELAEKSGEKNVKPAPRLNADRIRLQGKDGIYLRKTFTDEGKKVTEVGDELEGVMLRVRQSYFRFGDKYLIFTNEHNSRFENVSVFQKNKLKDGSYGDTVFLKEAPADAVREKMKLKKIIYLLKYPEKEIVKLQVKGAGLGPLFDYFSEFPGDEHIFQYLTSMGMSQETSDLGDYYAMTFQKERELEDDEMELVAEKIDEIFQVIQYRKQQRQEAEKQAEQERKEVDREAPPKKEDEVPIVEEEEIGVEDIPF